MKQLEKTQACNLGASGRESIPSKVIVSSGVEIVIIWKGSYELWPCKKAENPSYVKQKGRRFVWLGVLTKMSTLKWWGNGWCDSPNGLQIYQRSSTAEIKDCCRIFLILFNEIGGGLMFNLTAWPWAINSLLMTVSYDVAHKVSMSRLEWNTRLWQESMTKTFEKNKYDGQQRYKTWLASGRHCDVWAKFGADVSCSVTVGNT